MKIADLSNILASLAEENFPSNKVNLWPSIKNQLENHGQHSRSNMLHGSTNSKRSRRTALIFVAITITAFILLLASPQGQAFAQKVIRFFSTTTEKSFVLPTDMIFPVPPTQTPKPTYILPLETAGVKSDQTPEKEDNWSCSDPSYKDEYWCLIETVESQAGFDLKEFLYDPKGTQFSKVYYNPETKEAITEYKVVSGGGYLILRQGLFDYIPHDDPWSKVPIDAIDQVSVNGNYAEIASGTYVVYPDATEAVWEPGGQLSLVWREGSSWFVFEKWGDPYPIEWINKDEMIKLAESLTPSRPIDAVAPVDPENLTSIEEAQDFAKFDILTPTVLPEGFELQRVVYVNEMVHQLYGPQNRTDTPLRISMGPIEDFQAGTCTECPPGTVEDVFVNQWQGWYWRGIFSTGLFVEGQPTSTPEWHAEANDWSVVWNTDSLWIGVNFWIGDSGEVMNKETLLKIAESIH